MQSNEIVYEFGMNPVNPEVQALTNKFLADFFELVASNDSERKRDDSFAFHYTLADAIITSDYYQGDKGNDDSFEPLIGMSTLGSALVKGEFQYKTRKLFKDVAFLAEKFNENKNDRHNIEKYSDVIQSKEYLDIKWDENNEMSIGKVILDYRKLTLRMWNSGNLLDLNLVIEFLPTEKQGIAQQHGIDKISVLKGGEEIIRSSGRKTEICHFKFTPDINGFFSSLDQILFAINNPNEF